MDGRKGFFLIILFILLSTLVFAQESYENDISPSTRAYFDNQNQKVIAVVCKNRPKHYKS